MLTTTEINALITKCNNIGYYAFSRWAVKQSIRLETTLAIVRLAQKQKRTA